MLKTYRSLQVIFIYTFYVPVCTNTDIYDLRKIICLRKFESLTSKVALVCWMNITGAWYAFHTIAEME